MEIKTKLKYKLKRPGRCGGYTGRTGTRKSSISKHRFRGMNVDKYKY